VNWRLQCANNNPLAGAPTASLPASNTMFKLIYSRPNMNYTIRWTQPLAGWEPLEFEIRDFTEARKVLARIMAL
jgi:hypothetical protein